MAHRNARLTPVTRRRIGRTGNGWLAPRPKWPSCSASPARPSPSGCGGSAKADRTRSLTAPAAPCAAPARPVSCRKQPSALHAGLSPGGHTASGGGWASPAPPSTPSCAVPDSTASRGSIAPHGRSCATSMPAPVRWFTWTSRNSAASRRVAASASSLASPRPTAVLSVAPASVSTSSTWPWMTTPAMPTSRP